jgi:hypothetical protein
LPEAAMARPVLVWAHGPLRRRAQERDHGHQGAAWPLVLLPLAPPLWAPLPLCTLRRPLLVVPRRPRVLSVLLPLLLAHRLLSVVPATRLLLARSPSSWSQMRTLCACVARPTSHSPWIASISMLCPCRQFPAPFVMHWPIPIGALLCRSSMMPSLPMTPGVLCLAHLELMLWLGSGFIDTNCVGLSIATRLVGFFRVSPSGQVLIMMKPSARLSSQPLSELFSIWHYLKTSPFISSMWRMHFSMALL